MVDFKEEFEKWSKYVDEQSDVVAGKIRSTADSAGKVVKAERKKLELKSQIGEHQRAVTKAYTRLGEAYYEHENEGKEMDVKDIMDLIYSNKKVIDLLNEQLAALDKTEE